MVSQVYFTCQCILTEEVTKSGSLLTLGKNSLLSKMAGQRCDRKSQCANHFDHLGFLPKLATNHTMNLAKSHTDTLLRKIEK